ncbi:arginine deiminase family protein [Emticicia sp. C21]|uniref:arginine deiminase family protein n=1 Tax=Emticicia sp. C21 TaxID=2302915 RepID=UPI000E343718|nr:arginine deiminase family protein [Emticicia sp. C21]RFS18078.1 amidinotransferase [Emticicia sp. C21]
MQNIFVSSEVGTLRRLIIHSPDSGLGKVVPSKAQDWLFEDIVHLETMRRDEYDYYVKILLYFLDKEKVKGKLKEIDADASRDFYKPEKEKYFKSDKVIEFETLLADILQMPEVRTELTAAVCAVEECSFQFQKELAKLSVSDLVKVLITGTMPSNKMLFPPIPNLIFTRDIGIVVNDHLLLNKPAKYARTRESLLAKYIFFNHEIFADLRSKIVEITEDENHFLLAEDEQEDRLNTLEGGDVMMVAPNHLLIGVSERTTVEAARQAIELLFAKKVVKKVTIIKIPQKRDYMHIDTIFTQIKCNVWVLLGSLGRVQEEAEKQQTWEQLGQKPSYETLIIKQFIDKSDGVKVKDFANLEDLLSSITKDDLNCYDEIKFIYSGNNQFPYGAREQWTDSCNLLALKSGVAIGYDRNDHTAEAFRNAGFKTINAIELLEKFENDELSPEKLTDTIIMLPSAELSRARGGSHCMSLPILRDSAI